MPRPHVPDLVTKKAARKKEPMRMTIAIGTLCSDGLIVAADTRVVMSDGATSEGIKVHTGVSAACSFVIANATDDGNAANTLIPDIINELKEEEDLHSLTGVEANMRGTMAKWTSQHPHGAPAVQLIMGVYVNHPSNPVEPKNGGGLALYFCEPPNTMVHKGEFDNSRGYIAIGAGSVVD